MVNLVTQQLALPDYIDRAARTIPDAGWATVPLPDGTSPEYRWIEMTYSSLARAVDTAAWWVENNIGIGHDEQAIGFMAINDIRYPIFMAAALKAGYTVCLAPNTMHLRNTYWKLQPLLASPRNSVEGQISLIDATKCDAFLYSSEMEAQMKEISSSRPDLRTFVIPDLLELVREGEQPQTYAGRQSAADGAAAVILHTSGSTGLPKPITIRNGWLRTIPAKCHLPDQPGHTPITLSYLGSQEPLLTPLPFFHAMGLISVCRAIMCYKPVVFAPPVQVSASLVIRLIQERRPGFAVLAPSILEELAGSDEGLRTLGSLQGVIFGGAPLATAAGDKISQVTTLQPSIGSTETSMYATVLPESQEDWAYFRFHDVEGIEMQPVHEADEEDNGLREMVVMPKDRTYQGVFHTFPSIQEWRTKDLFMRHPSKEGYWKYQGRRDDVIVLSNGEKFNPVTTEKTVEGTPLLKGALVVGTGRFQAGILLEPIWDTFVDDETAVLELVEAVWPLIEKANSEAPAHARIYRSKILIAKAEKPLIRAAKGSIMRKATNALYKDEIQAMFANEDLTQQLGRIEPEQDRASVKAFLRKVFALCIPSFKGPHATDDADIFALGADSLGVLAIANALNHATTNSDKLMRSITNRIIYDNPTINKLCNVLCRSMVRRRHSSATGIFLSEDERMRLMCEEYTQDLEAVRRRASIVHSTNPTLPKKHTVILTGSTGSLGNHILAQLLRNDEVEMIYCLNRTLSAAHRQHGSLAAIGYDISEDELAGKCIFLKTDFSKTNFNIPSRIYTMLRETVTVFIHNAWAVDFNMSLESYEDTHVHGVRRVVDFAARSTLRPRVIFISSIASVGNWNQHAQPEHLPQILESDGIDEESVTTRDQHTIIPVPETLATVHDNRLPFRQGYAQSKHVSEQILAAAALSLGLPVSIVRCGQLAGVSERSGSTSPVAAWNKHEWLPTLIQTSKALGKIPRTLGKQDRVDWVPMDRAAHAVLDLFLHDNDHATKPNPFYDDVKEVSFDDWLKKLQRTNSDIERTSQQGRTTACEVLHLINPMATTWTILCGSVATFYRETVGIELEVIEYDAWLQELRQVPQSKEGAEKYPGIKLLEFYDSLSEENHLEAGLPVLDTKRMQQRSRTLRELEPINENVMRKWLEQWSF